jgi:nitrous oxidase accessory protein NosD
MEPADIYAVYHLPKLRDAPYGSLGGFLRRLRVVQRARGLDLIGMSALREWQNAASLATLAEQTRTEPQEQSEFRDGKASQLNRLLSKKGSQAIKVTSAAIEVDEPIRVSGSGVHLDLGSATLRGLSGLQYLLSVENANEVDIRGGAFLAGKSGILVSNSRGVRLSGTTLTGLAGVGVAIAASENVLVRNFHISGLKYAGIVLYPGVTRSVIEDNVIEGGLVTDDLAAAILLTDREVNPLSDSTSIYSHGVPGVRSLVASEHPPAGNLIRANKLLRNRAGGIYSSGAVTNVIASNVIAGNAKAGICLNDASISNIVTANAIRRNGSRWSEPNLARRTDTVADDAKPVIRPSAASLAGVSLDNALYNIVFQNSIENNYGGGIRLVRTGLLNVIGLNTIIGNADADSEAPTEGEDPHFFGIDLGATPADSTTSGLNATPSRGNILFSNLIRGLHYAGVHFAEGSDQNDVFDNTVLDATGWALESEAEMANNTLNNLTVLPSRNIMPGLDPRLFVTAREVVDESAP